MIANNVDAGPFNFDGAIYYRRAGVGAGVYNFDGDTEMAVPHSPFPGSGVAVDGVFYFDHADENGTELWRYDGLTNPTMVADLYPGGYYND
jgi:ELWxxDGT repeat protein